MWIKGYQLGSRGQGMKVQKVNSYSMERTQTCVLGLLGRGSAHVVGGFWSEHGSWLMRFRPSSAVCDCCGVTPPALGWLLQDRGICGPWNLFAQEYIPCTLVECHGNINMNGGVVGRESSWQSISYFLLAMPASPIVKPWPELPW